MSKAHLLQFIEGKINNLNYYQGALRSDLNKSQFSVDTVRSITLYIQDKGLNGISNSEMIQLAGRVQRESPSTYFKELEIFQRVFSKEVTEELIQECLNRREYDLIRTILGKRYIDLTAILLNWSIHHSLWLEIDLVFALQMVPFVKEIPLFLLKIESNIGNRKIQLSFQEMSRLERTCKAYNLNGLWNKAIHLKESDKLLMDEIIWYVRQQVNRPIFSTGITPHLIIYNLNDLLRRFLETGENEHEVAALILGDNLNAKFHITQMFLDMAIDTPHSNRAEKVIFWVSETSKMAFPNLIKLPRLQNRLIENRHPIIQILCGINGVEFSFIKQFMDKYESFNTVNSSQQGELEVALRTSRFDVAEELIRRGVRLPQNKSYFSYNITSDFLKYLHACKIIEHISEEDKDKMLTCCSIFVLEQVVTLYPSFSLKITDNLLAAYSSYFILRESKIGLMLEKKIEEMDQYYKDHHLPEQLIDQIVSVAHNCTPLFIHLKEICLNIYQKLNKTTFLDKLLRNSIAPVDLRLIQEIKNEVQWDVRRILNTCLKPGYTTGLLGEILENRDDLKHFFSDEIKRISYTQLNYPTVVSKEFFSDLYDLFAPDCKLQLFRFIIYLVNYRNQSNAVGELFQFLFGKSRDSHFSSFFRDENSRSPLLSLMQNHFLEISVHDLELLSSIRSYVDIFGESSEFLFKLLHGHRYDVYIKYLQMDPSIFNRRNRVVSVGFLLFSFGWLAVHQNLQREDRYRFLGLDGLLQLNKLNCNININSEIFFEVLRNDRVSYGLSNMFKIDRGSIEPFLPYLEVKNGSGNTPLLECAFKGKSRYILYLLQMGCSILATTLRGETFFDLYFDNIIIRKAEVLRFIYNNGIECASLLTRNNDGAFKKILRQGKVDELQWVFKILFLNPPNDLKRYLLLTLELAPSLLQFFISFLPVGVLNTLTPQEARLVYGTVLSRLYLAEKKIEFTKRVLSEIPHEDIFETALEDGELKVIQIFLQYPKIEVARFHDALKRCSINKLLSLNLGYLVEDRIVQQIEFVNDLCKFQLISKKIDTSFLRDLKTRIERGIDDGFDGIINYFYAFNSAFYDRKVIQPVLPYAAGKARYKLFLDLFEKFVPENFTTREEESPYQVITRPILKERLENLFKFIEDKTPFIGVPSDRIQFYEKLAYQLSCIYDFTQKIIDPEKKNVDEELCRQVVVRIAKGGPNAHCGTRWEDVALFYMNQLGSKIAPTTLDEWLLEQLNNYRVGCFEETVKKCGGSNDHYIPHERRKALFYLQKRGIKFYGLVEPIEDNLARSVREETVCQTFFSLHTPGGAYKFLNHLMNYQRLDDNQRDWIEAGIKSEYSRFSNNQNEAYCSLFEYDSEGDLLFFDLSGKIVPLGTNGAITRYKPVTALFLLLLSKVLLEK